LTGGSRRPLATLRRLDGVDEAASTHCVEIAAPVELVNSLFRRASIPDDVIVTSIERGRDLVVPSGDTVLPKDHV
jgi:Trk K+ transport system NAD-binding subunit